MIFKLETGKFQRMLDLELSDIINMMSITVLITIF